MREFFSERNNRLLVIGIAFFAVAIFGGAGANHLSGAGSIITRVSIGLLCGGLLMVIRPDVYGSFRSRSNSFAGAFCMGFMLFAAVILISGGYRDSASTISSFAGVLGSFMVALAISSWRHHKRIPPTLTL